MGLSDEQIEQKSSKKAAKKETKRLRRLEGASSGGAADWSSADALVLQRAIRVVADMGGALRLGYTRDGGAYAVGIYGDGEPFTEYVPPSEDITHYLQGLIEDYGK